MPSFWSHLISRDEELSSAEQLSEFYDKNPHHSGILQSVEDALHLHKPVSEAPAMTPTPFVPLPVETAPEPPVAPAPETPLPLEPISTEPIIPVPPPPHDTGFKGFLEGVAHVGVIAIDDVFRFGPAISTAVAIADPALTPEVLVFNAALVLAKKTIVMAEQKWATTPGSDETKLADVLTIIENPIVIMFHLAGKSINTNYIVSLINVAIGELKLVPFVPPTA